MHVCVCNAPQLFFEDAVQGRISSRRCGDFAEETLATHVVRNLPPTNKRKKNNDNNEITFICVETRGERGGREVVLAFGLLSKWPLP